MSTARDTDILEELYRVVLQRRSAVPSESYVASLLAGGTEAVCAKLLEEAGETVAATRGDDVRALVHEIADLWFHTVVLLGARGIAPSDVYRELIRRRGCSGLEEKAARSTSRQDR